MVLSISRSGVTRNALHLSSGPERGYVSSAERSFGSIRLNRARMRRPSLGGKKIACRTAAAMRTIIIWEKSDSDFSDTEVQRSQRIDEQAGKISTILFIKLLKRAVGLGRLPDVAHGRLVQEELIVAVRDAAEHP